MVKQSITTSIERLGNGGMTKVTTIHACTDSFHLSVSQTESHLKNLGRKRRQTLVLSKDEVEALALAGTYLKRPQSAPIDTDE